MGLVAQDRWLTYRIDDDVGGVTIYVVPANDFLVHNFVADCHCNPKVKWTHGYRMVVHNAWDEDADRAEELN